MTELIRRDPEEGETGPFPGGCRHARWSLPLFYPLLLLLHLLIGLIFYPVRLFSCNAGVRLLSSLEMFGFLFL